MRSVLSAESSCGCTYVSLITDFRYAKIKFRGDDSETGCSPDHSLWRDTVSDLRLDRWAGTETTNKPRKKLAVDFGVIADIKYTIPTAPSGAVANARPLPFARQQRLVIDRD